MKRRVMVSWYSMVMSVAGLAVLAWLFFYLLSNGEMWRAYVIGAITLTLSISALIYAPLSISVDDKALCVNRSLKEKVIPLSDIKSIELIQPTMAEKLILGSRGGFGYWGRFYEKSIGRYFAYYGKASDCFLVVLNDGRRYVLGCSDPAAIVGFVKARIA